MGSIQKNISLLVLTSGLAALSWEVIWQIKAALALGVSAYGAALILAITMGGMSCGALLAAQLLKSKTIARPLRYYALLEIIIGVSGLLLLPGFALIESIDTQAYNISAQNSALIHFAGITLMIGVPALFMGATLPVLGLIARQSGMSVARIYGLNTLGAAAGTLVAAIILLPLLGLTHTAWLIAGFNFTVAVLAWLMGAQQNPATDFSPAQMQASAKTLNRPATYGVVATTGFAIFMLEIAWFRSLTAAFHSTTIAFAMMLSVVLLALGLGAHLAPWLKKHNVSLGLILVIAAMLVLGFTPLIERLDLISEKSLYASVWWFVNSYLLTALFLAPPVILLGIALPWVLDDQHAVQQWGRLYSVNTLCAILGALSAAWIFLPTIGFAKTAWLAGVIIAITGMLLIPRSQRLKPALPLLAALLVAFVFETGIGTTRAQGWVFSTAIKPRAVLESYEGPDSTASAVEYENGARVLLIDGFAATQQSGQKDYEAEHYMVWMGHLPMLLHPQPQKALVICFGTGQTANAVRKENPERLDIVDINQNVFHLADNFTANDDVLDDPRVTPIVMDGRAYIRRTETQYDVITLEPMPPTFAGVNALYAREFYQQARRKLTENGMIAQWLPIHLVDTHLGASIVRTMQEIFPNAVLWMDPRSQTGIILASKNDQQVLGAAWPGFMRHNIKRSMPPEDVKRR